MQEIHILRVVVQSESCLHFAAPDAEPSLEFVIGDRPIQLRLPIAQVAGISDVYLRADAELVIDRHGHIQSGVSKGKTAAGGLHSEIVIHVRIAEALLSEAVDLIFTT